MVRHHAYLQLYPKIGVDGYIINDNNETNVHKQIWAIKNPAYPAEIQ